MLQVPPAGALQALLQIPVRQWNEGPGLGTPTSLAALVLTSRPVPSVPGVYHGTLQVGPEILQFETQVAVLAGTRLLLEHSGQENRLRIVSTLHTQLTTAVTEAMRQILPQSGGDPTPALNLLQSWLKQPDKALSPRLRQTLEQLQRHLPQQDNDPEQLAEWIKRAAIPLERQLGLGQLRHHQQEQPLYWLRQARLAVQTALAELPPEATETPSSPRALTYAPLRTMPTPIGAPPPEPNTEEPATNGEPSPPPATRTLHLVPTGTDAEEPPAADDIPPPLSPLPSEEPEEEDSATTSAKRPSTAAADTDLEPAPHQTPRSASDSPHPRPASTLHQLARALESLQSLFMMDRLAGASESQLQQSLPVPYPAFPQDGAQTVCCLTLPYQLPDQTATTQLRIGQRDAKGSQESVTTKAWVVSLRFDHPTLGTIQAGLELWPDHLDAEFWTESRMALATLRQAEPELRQRFEALGHRVDKVGVHEGLPVVDRQAQATLSLLDITI